MTLYDVAAWLEVHSGPIPVGPLGGYGEDPKWSIVKSFGDVTDASQIEVGKAEFARYAPVLEHALQGREYVAGKLSVADFSLAANADTAAMAGLDLAPYPNIRGWLERISQRDSWKKSAPQMPGR